MKKGGLAGRTRGLTLIEVLVATAILAAVLAPMLGMFTTGARGYNRSGQETVALNLARARLETYLAAGYDSLAGLPEANLPWQLYPGYPDYEYQVIVSDYGFNLEIKELMILVRPVNSSAGQVELATLVARWP